MLLTRKRSFSLSYTSFQIELSHTICSFITLLYAKHTILYFGGMNSEKKTSKSIDFLVVLLVVPTDL